MINSQLKDAPDFVKETLASMDIMDIDRQGAGEMLLSMLLESMIDDSGVKLSPKKARMLADALCNMLSAFTHNEPDALAWMLAAMNGMAYNNNAGKRLHDFYPEEYGHA